MLVINEMLAQSLAGWLYLRPQVQLLHENAMGKNRTSPRAGARTCFQRRRISKPHYRRSGTAPSAAPGHQHAETPQLRMYRADRKQQGDSIVIDPPPPVTPARSTGRKGWRKQPSPGAATNGSAARIQIGGWRYLRGVREPCVLTYFLAALPLVAGRASVGSRPVIGLSPWPAPIPGGVPWLGFPAAGRKARLRGSVHGWAKIGSPCARQDLSDFSIWGHAGNMDWLAFWLNWSADKAPPDHRSCG